MPFLTTCPGCHASLRLAETLAGKMVRCQKCSTMFLAPQPEAAPAAPEPIAVAPLDLSAADSTEPTNVSEQIFDAKATKPPFLPMKIVEAKTAEPPDLAPLKLAKNESSDGRHDGKDRQRPRRPAPAAPKSSAAVWVTVGLVLLFFAGILAFSAGAGAWFLAARPAQGHVNVAKENIEFNEKEMAKEGGKQIEKIGDAPVRNLPLDADGRAEANEDRVFGPRTYRVQLQANQKYNVLVHCLFGMMPRLEVDDGAGLIASREGNKDVFLPFVAKRTGEHTIRIIPRFGANNDSFDLRIAQVVVEAPTPIDFAAQPSVVEQGALRLHDPVLGEQPFDCGLYREYSLPVKTGHDYLFKLGAVGFIRPVLLLKNGAAAVAEKSADINTRIDFTYRADFTGKLRVFVTTKANLPGDFTLTVTEEGPGPRQVAFDFAGKYLRDDNLANTDPLNPRLGRVKTYYIPMDAGQGYNIEQRSAQLDAFLSLYDPDDNLVVEDNNSGGNYNARILFDPKVTGKYRLLASDFKKGAGAFTIDITRIKLPASFKADNPLTVKKRQQNGCDIAEAPVPGLANTFTSFAWSADGKAFFLLDTLGALRRYRYPEFVEERSLALSLGQAHLHVCAEGLLAAGTFPNEMWILDPQTLDLKCRIVRVGINVVHTRPGLDVAYTASDVIFPNGTRSSGLAKHDLKKPNLNLIGNLTKGTVFHALTPDGRFILSRDPDGKMVRWRIDERNVTREEASRHPANPWPGTFQPFLISPDGKLFAHQIQTRGIPADDQPPRTPSGFGVAVYRVDNLKKPLFAFDTDAYTSAVAFDKTTGLLCAFTKARGLMLVDQAGKLVREIKIDLPDPFAPALWHMEAHPDGGALVGFTGNVFNPKLMTITLPRDLPAAKEVAPDRNPPPEPQKPK